MPKKPKINHVDGEEPRKDTIKWSKQMDIVLIDALLEQQAKPNAKKWRHTPIHHYDKLSELFAKDKANGEGAISAKEKVQQWEIEGSPNHVMDVEHLDEWSSSSPLTNLPASAPFLNIRSALFLHSSTFDLLLQLQVHTKL
ncbi:hypothetical protein Ddye_004664 [Dipteronia dyeriana]|uniref:Uncharacterized protein n=1 Tax=Dipteronia dyeriana TaxID=168575 RepID=A0AAD9XV99_9ROSI|nr:hypothetical protein Ddye_004664 [Dipteronia dyeriana]